MKKLLSRLVFWLGVGGMGLLAIPFGLSLCGIWAIQFLMDRLLKHLETP